MKPFRKPERTVHTGKLLSRPAAARPPSGMQIGQVPQKVGTAPSGPGRGGPSPPRTSPTASQNRLRVTSPPFPAGAGLRPDPPVVRPDLSAPGSLPRGSRHTYGPTGSSGGGSGGGGGGWRLRPSSEHTAQQHPGPPATRRMYVTPLPRDFRARDCPAPSSVEELFSRGGALLARPAAEGRASGVTTRARGRARSGHAPSREEGRMRETWQRGGPEGGGGPLAPGRALRRWAARLQCRLPSQARGVAVREVLGKKNKPESPRHKMDGSLQGFVLSLLAL